MQLLRIDGGNLRPRETDKDAGPLWCDSKRRSPRMQDPRGLKSGGEGVCRTYQYSQGFKRLRRFCVKFCVKLSAISNGNPNAVHDFFLDRFVE